MNPLATKLLGETGLTSPFKILALLTLLSVLPALVLTMTSFVRTVVVLSFVRQGIGTQQTPPTQVISPQVADQAFHPGRLRGDGAQEPPRGLGVPGQVDDERAHGRGVGIVDREPEDRGRSDVAVGGDRAADEPLRPHGEIGRE